jgi:hypothetical protein
MGGPFRNEASGFYYRSSTEYRLAIPPSPHSPSTPPPPCNSIFDIEPHRVRIKKELISDLMRKNVFFFEDIRNIYRDEREMQY